MIIQSSGGSKLIDPNFVLEKVGVREKMEMADLGCGAIGHFVFPAARLVGREGLVYAVDIQRGVLENIEKRAELENLPQVICVWSDLERWGAAKIESGTLDLAFLINTLFQNKDRPTVLREAGRLLKIGGKLAVVDWLLTGAPFGPPVEGRVDPVWVESEMDKIGFHLLTRFSPGHYHYGLVFEK